MEPGVVDNNVERLSASLRRLWIYPCAIAPLVQHLRHQWLRAQIQAGERVGITAAQSVGQIVTQLVLNTFHLSGVLNVSSVGGVGRLEEVLAVTKRPKGVHVRAVLVPRSPARACDFQCHTLGDVVESWEVVVDGDQAAQPAWKKAWWTAFGYRSGLQRGKMEPVFARLVMSRQAMYRWRLSPWIVSTRLGEGVHNQAVGQLTLVPSPDLVGEIHVHLPKATKWRASKIFAGLVQNGHAVQADELSTFVQHALVPELLKFLVGGIPGVTRAWQPPHSPTIYMEPSNFREVLNHEEVDFRTVHTTDFAQCLQILGIEAARALLVQEIVEVLEMGGGAGAVDRRHVMVLADTMTLNGTLQSVSRYGIDRADVGPLAKASFEQMLDNFVKAAYRREYDALEGVSGAIITGKPTSFGTASVELRMDASQRSAASYAPPKPITVADRVTENGGNGRLRYF